MNNRTITTLCLVRHGQSTFNAERRIQGQLDPPLSALGKEQAAYVAPRLAKESWSVLYASDLTRAHQTAVEVSKHTGLPIVSEPLLREQREGKREGLLFKEAKVLFPDINAPETEAETNDEAQQRAVLAFETLRDRHLGERILIVGHGRLMRFFFCAVLGPYEKLPIPNTACTLLHWDGNRWTAQYIADSSHLPRRESL